jgi:hypothetical protein
MSLTYLYLLLYCPLIGCSIIIITIAERFKAGKPFWLRVFQDPFEYETSFFISTYYPKLYEYAGHNRYPVVLSLTPHKLKFNEIST